MSGPVSAVAPVTDSPPPLNRAPVFRTTVRIEKNRGHHGNDHWRLRHRARRHLAFPAEPQRPHASRRRGARGGVLRQRLQRQPDDPAGRRLPAFAGRRHAGDAHLQQPGELERQQRPGLAEQPDRAQPFADHGEQDHARQPRLEPVPVLRRHLGDGVPLDRRLGGLRDHRPEQDDEAMDPDALGPDRAHVRRQRRPDPEPGHQRQPHHLCAQGRQAHAGEGRHRPRHQLHLQRLQPFADHRRDRRRAGELCLRQRAAGAGDRPCRARHAVPLQHRRHDLPRHAATVGHGGGTPDPVLLHGRHDHTSGKTRTVSEIIDAEGNRTTFKYAFNRNNFSQYVGGTTWMVNALGVKRTESNDAELVQWRLDNGYYQTWDAGRYTTDAAFRAQADDIRTRHTTLFTYDAHGQLLTVTEPLGFTASYAYDANENLITVADANADAITRSDDQYFRDLRRDFGYVNPLTGQGKLVSELTAAERAALKERFTTRS